MISTLITLLLPLILSPQTTPAEQVQRGQMKASLNVYQWEMLTPEGETSGRHECSFVEFEDKFYLIGGRGVHEVGIYDPATNRWEAGAKSPIEINHFQAVVVGDAIYMVGAMNGRYPVEQPLENVWIYYPKVDRWEMGDPIPKEHRRGGAGCVEHNGKIYLACGIENGHTSGTTNIFSCYDPSTGEWSVLPKAPHIRDHFSAIVYNGKLYCIGGRNGSIHYKDNFGAFFSAVERAVDVYDFESGKWLTLKDPLPIGTAAAGVTAAAGHIIYVGGEGENPLAYTNTQALNMQTFEWSQLAPMVKGMHGSGAIYHNGMIYWAAGSYKKGGSNLNDLQRFSPSSYLQE